MYIFLKTTGAGMYVYVHISTIILTFMEYGIWKEKKCKYVRICKSEYILRKWCLWYFWKNIDF